MSTDPSLTAPWRPVAGVAEARLRAAMLKRARQFFEERQVLEVETPMLSLSAISEPNIESIAARLALVKDRDYYLHTSPEFCMKRLLAAGFPDIYQVCRVFRDGESGRRHQPEFTMVEWYRHGFGLGEMMRDTADFIAAVLDPARLTAPADYLSYRDAVQRVIGPDPLTASIGQLALVAEADADLAAAIGDDRDQWLDLIMGIRVAPQFPADRLTIVHHYPASQAALARACPDDADVADRFEIFFGRLELANGFVELSDSGEQRRRFARDQEIRRSRGLPLRPIDDKFIAALEAGLPPCAGVAVGFDRLHMINAGVDDIRSVRHFPFEMPE